MLGFHKPDSQGTYSEQKAVNIEKKPPSFAIKQIEKNTCVVFFYIFVLHFIVMLALYV
jgi:hypothetical protein